MIVTTHKVNNMRTAFIENRNGKFYANDGVGYIWKANGQPFKTKKAATKNLLDALCIRR